MFLVMVKRGFVESQFFFFNLTNCLLSIFNAKLLDIFCLGYNVNCSNFVLLEHCCKISLAKQKCLSCTKINMKSALLLL